MAGQPFDPLKSARRLSQSGLERDHAEAVAGEFAQVINEVHDAAVTKAELRAAIVTAKNELIVCMLIIAGVTIGAIKLI